ncbi:hypothetical protein [Sideroxydans sp. CL21]|uniref:hypothetical protein n=1 Tax=Sideroxydans sp. CL21 TaxID=2600596 RepID=UPI0024BC6523|nr:hypothetical protein [Sideroxydans sp. CL21]
MLLHDDGAIHYPFSKYLTDELDNPHTREKASQALRIFYRLLASHNIELAVRALEGRCLTHNECKSLAGLCYRKLKEIELLSNRKVVLLTSAMADIEPDKLPKALQPNTARKSLIAIADYLKFYWEVFLDPHIRSENLRIVLKEAYEQTQDRLKKAIHGTKQNHHLTIRSLPSRRFLELIRKVVLEPESLFLTAGGKTSATLYRDRAMVLVACEGVRPGAIGNIARADFREKYLAIQDHRRRREGRTTTGAPVLKLGDTTRINSASETMLTLYPFTTDAINDYIRFERDPILAKHQRNRSLGFLFLNEKGEPIKHRSSITAMFKRLGERLAQQGLLDIGNDPYFPDQSQYEFYGYVLRHSAASFFLEMKGTEDGVLDSMKTRFGWTMESSQPQRYANRALSDQAGVDLMQFYEQLIADVAAAREME